MSAAAARIDRTALLAAPGLAYLLVVYAIPLALLLSRSVWTADGPSVAGFTEFLGSDFGWRVLGNTLRVATLVTLFSLLIGYPVAFALARARGLPQLVLLVAIILPLSVGVVVKAFSWQIVFRRDGVFNLALQSLGLVDEPVRLLFTETGLVMGAVNIFLPFMVLPIYSVVKLLDSRLNDAAATLGASPLYRFQHVVLPLTLPGVIAGIAFVFSMSISMYVIPTLLIGDRFQTLATLTGRSFLFMRNEQLGSTTAVILLGMSIAVVAAASWIGQRVRGESR